jgi:hypothetical protein
MSKRTDTERLEETLVALIKSHQALLGEVKRSPGAKVNYKLADRAVTAAGLMLEDLRMGEVRLTRSVLAEDEDDFENML